MNSTRLLFKTEILFYQSNDNVDVNICFAGKEFAWDREALLDSGPRSILVHALLAIES